MTTIKTSRKPKAATQRRRRAAGYTRLSYRQDISLSQAIRYRDIAARLNREADRIEAAAAERKGRS